MPVTYCPEDNKIRIYCGWLPRDEYERLRKNGFIATPKQECDFVAVWTPGREDLACEYLEEGEIIADEDYSPGERAADRAERFAGYQTKRLTEAQVKADRFDSGPQVFGNQSIRRAEQQAARHDRHRVAACEQWRKAEYWRDRVAGVIANALYKSSPRVRRGRIVDLEKEERGYLDSNANYTKRFRFWESILNSTDPSADQPLPLNPEGFRLADNSNPFQQKVYAEANDGTSGWRTWHPEAEEANEARRLQSDGEWCRGFSAYDLLTKESYNAKPWRRLTPREVACGMLHNQRQPEDPTRTTNRLLLHTQLRLSYERMMLEEAGGMASDCQMVPGGFFKGAQILRVTKSPITKKIVSVVVDLAGSESRYNVQKSGRDSYRAPTPEELTAFHNKQKEDKAEKAKQPKERTAPIINPTIEEAQKLQDYLNDQAQRDAGRHAGTVERSTIATATQAVYSRNSKGGNGPCKMVVMNEFGNIKERVGRCEVFKFRVYTVGRGYGSAPRVLVLTDKPQRECPWADIETMRAEQPTEETMLPHMPFLCEVMRGGWQRATKLNPEERRIVEDARYAGILWFQAISQMQWTERGADLAKEYLLQNSPA